jgi:hypothetical protein
MGRVFTVLEASRPIGYDLVRTRWHLSGGNLGRGHLVLWGICGCIAAQGNIWRAVMWVFRPSASKSVVRTLARLGRPNGPFMLAAAGPQHCVFACRPQSQVSSSGCDFRGVACPWVAECNGNGKLPCAGAEWGPGGVRGLSCRDARSSIVDG